MFLICLKISINLVWSVPNILWISIDFFKIHLTNQTHALINQIRSEPLTMWIINQELIQTNIWRVILNWAERNFLNRINLNCPKCLNSLADLSVRCFPEQCFFHMKSSVLLLWFPNVTSRCYGFYWLQRKKQGGDGWHDDTARKWNKDEHFLLLFCNSSCRSCRRIGWGRFLCWHKMRWWQGWTFGRPNYWTVVWFWEFGTKPNYILTQTELKGPVAFGWTDLSKRKKKEFFFEVTKSTF